MSKTVGVRLSDSDHRTLLAKTRKDGVKVSDHLRRLILEDLSGTTAERLLTALSELQGEVQTLRESLGRMCVALLVDAGKCSLTEAEAWAEENLSI